MKKNVITIVFLFSLIFVTLMFGQEVEGFAYNYVQTDPNGGNGTYFTKETSGVSVFSALNDFSKRINDVGLGQAKTNLQTCLDDTTASPNDKQMCYNNYSLAIQSSINFTEANNKGKILVDAVNRNTMAPLSDGKMDPTDIRVSNDAHESNKLHVKTTYRSNRQIQLDLDRKMNEMLSEKSGIKLDSATKQNSTMYVGILWTVSAATALYYIFNKI